MTLSFPYYIGNVIIPIDLFFLQWGRYTTNQLRFQKTGLVTKRGEHDAIPHRRKKIQDETKVFARLQLVFRYYHLVNLYITYITIWKITSL